MDELELHYISPAALHEQANEEMALIPLDRLFNDPRYQKVGEKWCAALFARGYEKLVRPALVAINETSQRADADFFLKVDDVVEPFQIVEVMEPERRRGAEYKAFARGELRHIAYEPERGHINGPAWIGNAIRQKVEKKYAGSTELNLLIYGNFSAQGIEHGSLVAASVPYHASFASIWIITNLHIATLSASKTLGEIGDWGEIQTKVEYNLQVDLRGRPTDELPK